MNDAKPAVTLMKTSKIEILPNGYKCSHENRNWYAKIIESLMYAILGIRMNIDYSVLFFSRIFGNPDLQHICTTKRIMQYFCGTTKLE